MEIRLGYQIDNNYCIKKKQYESRYLTQLCLEVHKWNNGHQTRQINQNCKLNTMRENHFMWLHKTLLRQQCNKRVSLLPIEFTHTICDFINYSTAQITSSAFESNLKTVKESLSSNLISLNLHKQLDETGLENYKKVVFLMNFFNIFLQKSLP